ncbi:MAG: hypothetical protein V4610_20575 [Pseudomonadota bacterium]|jgi:hypothetical protein|uniref:Uncharacterized protein n=1 Tax=hydrothermal vent metagenome TaxID=652676 RepID=A0A160TH80_9ZZZZ
MTAPDASHAFCLIDGRPATVEALLPVATINYGRITIMQSSMQL